MNSPTFLLVALIALQLAAAAPTGSQHNSAERLDRFDELDNLGRETSEISRQVVSADDVAYIPKVAMDPNATSSTERPLLPSTTTVDSPVQHRELDDSPIKVNETTFDDYSTPPVTLSTNRPTSSVPDATTLTVASSSLSPAGSSTPRPSVSPRKKLRRSTTTTAVPPLINYSQEMDTSSSTASSDYATEAPSIPPSSTAAASARPKTRKQRKKVTKKMDVEESSTQSLELATLTINSEGTTTSRSSTSQQTESTTISLLETTTEEERVIATESPSIDEYDRGNPLATVPPATTTTTSTTTTRMEEATTEEELETSTPLEVETEFELKSTTWTPIPITNNITAEDESITIRYQAITTSDERTTSPVATTTDRQVYVTHTPFEVSSVPENIASRGPNERLLPATTVFEDIKNSAITTTTEFISTTPELKETTTLQQFSTTTQEERTTTPHQILTTQEEEQTTTQQAAIPTSEPHVDGINVENVEESLSPIPADDVLVVEIEDSSEPAATPRASLNLDVTETFLTEEEAPQRRPKINDELFFPIGGEVGEGGDGGDDLETRDETSDGQSNDNDGDFDLEAEIFPTIPVLKNSLFESEILREKADLVEQEQDVDDFEPVTVTQPTTRTSLAPSTSTSTSTQRPSTSSTRTSTTARAVAETTTQANVVDQNNTDFSTVSHDSDTFFYISNTEVKVVEEEDEEPSREQQPTDTELSFPENTDSEGVFVPLSDQNHSGRRVAADELSSPPLLDENIILSPVGGGGGGVGGRMGKEIKKKEPFSLVKFSAADKPHRLPVDRDDNDGGEREEQGQQDDLTKNTGSTEQLSFVRVEETTDIFSSEEAFNFLNQRRRLPLRSKEDTIPDVIIEPYPQLMDTDADLPLSIGVPVIAELPPQIKLSTSDERAVEPFAGYHHFDIDNRQVEESMDSRAAQKEIKTVRKLKKSRGGKKLAKKRLDREDQFSDIIFENAENYLVKNPAISLEVPVLDFNFTILTTSTMEPRLNFTNETTLMLEEEPIGINDLQTLFLTCFITLLLLLVVGCLAFVARFYWIKHYSYGTGLIGDNSTDLLATKSRTLSAEEFKSQNSGMSVLRGHEMDGQTTQTDQYGNGILTAAATTTLLHNNKNGDAALSEVNGQAKTVPYSTTGANGSIITMTLKNNHLIVETEERSDISRDARETKMHYSPSDKDGVFVVEVARGADTSYHSPRTATAPPFNGVDLLNTSATTVANQEHQQQRVQVHHHPPPPAAALNGRLRSSTGLSQSDLSDSSSGGSNKDYNYGSQGGPYSTDCNGGGLTGIKVLPPAHPLHQQRTVVKQETIDLEPRLQSDIDLFNVETQRRDHCNGLATVKEGVAVSTEGSNGGVMPDILVKSLVAPSSIDQSVDS